MNRICSYGNYRNKGPNFEQILRRHGSDSLLYRKTIKIPGFKMYDLIYSPTIEPTGDSGDLIVVDLMYANDKVYNMIKQSYNGLGLIEDIVWIEEHAYSIFIDTIVSTEAKYKEIEDGDWISVLKNNYSY